MLCHKSNFDFPLSTAMTTTTTTMATTWDKIIIFDIERLSMEEDIYIMEIVTGYSCEEYTWCLLRTLRLAKLIAQISEIQWKI